jgi:hypothetical protein
MAINVNKVYRVVLAVLNKEQRGLLTPDQYNRLARLSQLDLIEKAFHDYNRAVNRDIAFRTSTEYGDISANIKEKIDALSKESTLSISTGTVAQPADLYKVIAISTNSRSKQIEEIQKSRLIYLNASKLTTPSSSFPVYYLEGTNIKILPNTFSTATIDYIKVPADPNWAFTGGGTAAYVYDSENSVDFELHPSEEIPLVTRILAYAGVIVKDPAVVQAAATKEANDFNQENS